MPEILQNIFDTPSGECMYGEGNDTPPSNMVDVSPIILLAADVKEAIVLFERNSIREMLYDASVPKKAGVYLIYCDGKPFYAGKSDADMHSRTRNHKQKLFKMCGATTEEQRKRYEVQYWGCGFPQCKAFEEWLIAHYNPSEQKTGFGNNPCGKKRMNEGKGRYGGAEVRKKMFSTDISSDGQLKHFGVEIPTDKAI